MSNALDIWDAADPKQSAQTDVAKLWDEAAPIQQKQPLKADSPNSPIGSDWQNFAAGAGKSIVDLGRGAKQLVDIPAQFLEKRFPGVSAWAQEKGFPSAAQSAANTNADVTESRVNDAPLMDTKAGIAGNIAGNIAGTMVPLSIAAKSGNLMNGANAAKALLNPQSYKAAATAGALTGALTPTLEDESTVHNALLGAGVGMGGNLAINTLGRIAQPVKNMLSAAHAKAVDVLEQAGIPLDAAQKTGSAFLNKIRSSFSDNPFISGKQADLIGAQKSGYNRAVLNTIGENANAATPDVMNAASNRINGTFKDILDRNNVKINDPTLERIATIQQKANDEEKTAVGKIADRLMSNLNQDGTIPGQAAYSVKKDLDRLANSPDTTLGYHAKQLRSTLMDAINSSLSGEDQQAFSQARNQFSNMKKIESVIDREGNGDISPAKLANVMAQKANRNASVYGRGDQQLVDLAHSGNMLLPDKMPNSGSIARGVMQMTLPLVAGGAQGAATGDWEGAAKTAGAMYVLPKAAQMLINSPSGSNYLANGLQGGLTPLRNLLETPQTNQYVGGSLRRLPESYLNSKTTNR